MDLPKAFDCVSHNLLLVKLVAFEQLRFIFSLDLCFPNYDRFMIIRDINVQLNRERIKLLCESCKLKSLIKEPKCFKNSEYPSCIYLTLTNSPYHFQILRVIETGLLHVHKMTVTVLKTKFERLKPKIMHYCGCKTFLNDSFLEYFLPKHFWKI